MKLLKYDLKLKLFFGVRLIELDCKKVYNDKKPNFTISMLCRHRRKRIRILEEEVARWQLIADMVTEIDPSPFEEGSYAMLRGKQVRYLMRSREVRISCLISKLVHIKITNNRIFVGFPHKTVMMISVYF